MTASLLALLATLVAAPMPNGMVLLPAGQVTPFYKDIPAREAQVGDAAGQGGAVPVDVSSFWLDVRPVTTAEFVAFVKVNPTWRRSRIAPLFADTHYLSDWSDDVTVPEALGAASVTSVSWFAARAYCRAQGKRLPTTAEWEYAAEDLRRDRDGATARILAWYQSPARDSPVAAGQTPRNGFGVRDMYGVNWEWTSDFNDVMTADESRGGAGAAGQFCGSAGAAAVDPSDTAAFMRWAFRGSLKASYTTRDLSFRCAKDATP